MKTRANLLTTLALATPLAIAQAQTVQTASSPSSVERTIQNIKNPVPWLSWGGDLRIRNEYLDNTITLSPQNHLHEQDYFRFRARVWATLLPTNDFSINVRIADEARDWVKPAGYGPLKRTTAPGATTAGGVGPDWGEGIVDNLNVRWRNVLGQPAAITVGRQDIFLGDGWLVGDGTPFDGSWTYFLDSARATYELKEQHTIIDAIGILQDARDNGWLPPIADETQKRFLTEQNEKGAILNVANTSLKEANVTGYFIYKHDSVATGPGKPRGGDEADIYTLGGRLNGLLGGDHWKYWIEGAYQLGQKRDPDIHDDAYNANHAVANSFRDINAFGANTRLTYLFNDKLNNQLTLSYEYLSGDSPGSKKDEMFDVLWGRWPHWSEIGLYSFAAETRIGQEANLHRVGPTWSLTPVKNLDFSLSYWALFAPQNVATRVASTTLIPGTGDFRGHFMQAVLKYKFSSHMAGHLWAEYQLPGDYYKTRDLMAFLRAELSLTF